MAFAGLCVILQTVRVGILEYRELNVINTLVSFFLPIVYLLLVTPLEYAFELYSKYEMLFIQMHFKEPSDKMADLLLRGLDPATFGKVDSEGSQQAVQVNITL